MKNNNTSVEVVGTTNPTPQENKKGTANGELPSVINWGDVERHEANAMLPPMLPEQLKRLKEDIRDNGLKVPIVRCGGQVLDGWHRYQICRQLKIEPRFEEFTGKSPLLECWSLNVSRRHLEKSQLAVLANEMMGRLLMESGVDSESDADGRDKNDTESTPVESGESTEVGKKKTKRKRGRTRSAVSKALGVSEGYIQKAKELKESDPDLYAKVGTGKLNLHQAQRQARGSVYRKRETAAKDTTSLVIEPNDNRFTLHNCDILEASIEDGSLDAIITDPPYGNEYLECWSKIGTFASRKLKDGGILLAMASCYHLPAYLQNLSVEGLNYHWTLCYGMPEGGSRPQGKRIGCHWKPILWYVKGKYDRTFQPTDLFMDEQQNSDDGKRYHKWGQSLPFFTMLVEKFTYADELVCDPCLGGGTTGIACLSLKRRFIGIDIDPEAYGTSQKRLSEWKPEPIAVDFVPQGEDKDWMLPLQEKFPIQKEPSIQNEEAA